MSFFVEQQKSHIRCRSHLKGAPWFRRRMSVRVISCCSYLDFRPQNFICCRLHHLLIFDEFPGRGSSRERQSNGSLRRISLNNLAFDGNYREAGQRYRLASLVYAERHGSSDWKAMGNGDQSRLDESSWISRLPSKHYRKIHPGIISLFDAREA